MKDVLFSVIVLQCLFVVRGSDFYESSFSNIVGCLERTQVTFLIRGPYFSFNENMVYQLMEFLSESPCHTPYIFINSLKRSIQWKHIRFNFDPIQKRLSITDLVAIIEDETFVENTIANKQTLLFFGEFFVASDDGRALRALDEFENKKDRNVIFVDYGNYEHIRHIPFNRVVLGELLNVELLINLVINPNYNNAKYIKHFKIKDARLRCLKNKTIHIITRKFVNLQGKFKFQNKYDVDDMNYLSLMKSIVILVQNTQELSTKIKFYYADGISMYGKEDYEKRFLDYHGISSSKHFNMYYFSNEDEWIEMNLAQSIKRESVDIYMLYEHNALSYRFTYSYRIFHGNQKLCTNGVKGRKHVVYNPSRFQNIFQKCKAENFKVSHFKTLEYKINVRNLIGEVLSAACF